jgi:integrase
MPSRLSDGPAATRSATGYLLAGGVPLKQVQEWMGHHDAAFTMAVYAQARRSDVPDLDALFHARDASSGRP